MRNFWGPSGRTANKRKEKVPNLVSLPERMVGGMR